MVSIIVAADEKNVIGKNNQLPWHLPADLKYFKNLTYGNVVIMGRKTFESMGKSLPGRLNIILTSNQNFQAHDAVVVDSLQSAIKKASEENFKDIFIIGGGEVFKNSFAIADQIYLTRIKADVGGDIFFPEINVKDWEKIKSDFRPKDEKNIYDMEFELWRRR